jgi:hypothetical protein
MKLILIDTSFLYALNDLADRNREKALKFATGSVEYQYIVPQVALAEAAYMLQQHVGERALLNFWEGLESPEVHLQPVEKADLRRAREIRLQYADAHFDFVDCCIKALSERLKITQICTFDRRDFSIFRPSHTDYLELLP